MDKVREKLVCGIQAIMGRIAPITGKAILFGSRARGDARETSDWDILVLLDKDRITVRDMDEISYPIHEISWEIDEMVNPVMYTTRDWESKKGTPFYENVMKEGVALWA
jgi:predicted nucleotidyltransferase